MRDHPGSGRDPLLPVPAAVQRDALDSLARGVLSVDSFRLSPALQRKLAPDFNERGEALSGGDGPVSTDYSIIGTVLDMQRALLAQLMSDGVAARLLDSEGKVAVGAGGKPGDSFRLSELYATLTREVWSELGTAGDITRRGANCSANTSIAWPRACCAAAAGRAPTPRVCCANRHASCWRASTPPRAAAA